MDPWAEPFPELALAGGRLRQWRVEDAPVLVRAWHDPEIVRWNSVPSEPDAETATRWIAGVDERRARRLAADFTIEIDDRGIVGEVGLSGFTPVHRGALIGYWLLPDARGHGYAAAAVHALTAWAHRALDLQVIVARCNAENEASQSVAERAGFALESTDDSGHRLWRSRAAAPLH